ncbi:MAG: Sulfate permease 2 [Chrysothrix sp. TS-e1954]|nr:MAG: Sulfate permease 2 [Chrysothrix sp. TS-e1954]
MSASAWTKLGHGVAKVLGIHLDYRNETGQETHDRMTRGESVFSVSSADDYIEKEPTALEWITENTPDRQDAINYCLSLFPFTHWILRYNLQWLIGDLVAGITIGAVVVPQGMAYAKLAELPVQYGLYSAFMGTLIYWIFATSKDITIGPVAVLSTVTGNVVLQATSDPAVANLYSKQEVAQSLAIIAGSVVAFIGIIRLGWIVEFISLTAVSAFITGSAFYIAMGQVPGLLGISKKYVNSRAATYKVVIGTLQNLDKTKLDAAIGLTGLLMLYLIKYTFVYLAKRYPAKRKGFFFANTLRTVFVILLYTLIGWLVNMHHREKPKFKILGHVPRGFTDAGVPTVNKTIIKSFAGQLPVTIIVMLIEHIAISKSFGRINNYTINPSQELLAIGATNCLGPFLGAYPATGSFSRTAIKSKAGVRTPLAGVITALVVLLAIYALPAVFFYIPNAILSAVIIHAVMDLITPANTLYQFWMISPLEVPIFLAGVFVTVFSSIENGIYTTICVSAALLLYRLAKARGRFLGKIKVHSVIGDHIGSETKGISSAPEGGNTSVRNVFLPIDHRDGSNPTIGVSHTHPGVFIFRFSEGFNYPNASHYFDHFVATIFRETRRTDTQSILRPGDRPWNEPGPRKGKEAEYIDYKKPTLKAVILDFSSVNNVDVTSVQHMIDVRNQLDRYASPDTVEWHLACINNRWAKRALASAGFGYPTPEAATGDFHRWKPVYSVAEMGGVESAAAAAEDELNRRRRNTQNDVKGKPIDVQSSSSSDDNGHYEQVLSSSKAYQGPEQKNSVRVSSKVAVVQGLNRPLFHVDLTSALQSAITNIKTKEAESDEHPRKGYGTIDADDILKSA